MITSIFISAFYENFDNGVNIEINRCDNDDNVTIKIVDDGEKYIIPSFEINYKELKSAILKLDFKNET